MLHWPYTYAASICFSNLLVQTYVASVLSRRCICCSCHTHMFQAYVLNVSSVFRHVLQQMLHVASVPWVGARSGRRWSPWTQRPPHAHGKRSKCGSPHVHVQQQGMRSAAAGRPARQARQQQCGARHSNIVQEGGGRRCIIHKRFKSCRVTWVSCHVGQCCVWRFWTPRALLLCVCLTTSDVFDVIIWGWAASVGVRTWHPIRTSGH
jgi:hypothetical protein